MTRHGLGLSSLMGAALASGGAHAQEAVVPPYSIDVELLRPAFGHQGFAGVDAPFANRNLTLRYGTVLQYTQAPLTLYNAIDDEELGAVVTNRFTGLFGASIDVERVTFSVLLPTALNWGTQVPPFGADGFGVGDAGASARLLVVQSPDDAFNVGVRAGLILPTGKQNAYIGEGRLRFGLGLLASLQNGPLTLASDLGLHTRTRVETSEDFVASNELAWGNAARLRLPDASRLGVNAQLLTRAGFSEFLRGGAENTLEAIGGLEIYPTRSATISLGAGRGLTQGYGSTDFRVLTGLVIESPPREDPRKIYVNAAPPPPPPPPPVEELVEEVVVFEEGELAKKVGKEIFIKEMVEFTVGTNIIQEFSKPGLRAVAKVINDDPAIAHVVVEGHASQEGTYEYNYTLAESRSRRIWEYFMELGVAKERISYRGMGEVQPKVVDGVAILGEDEASLQKNRRVNFLVIRQFEGPDEFPDYPDAQILPWNAIVVPVVKPPKPEVKVDEGPKLNEFGMPMDEDDLDVGEPTKKPKDEE